MGIVSDIIRGRDNGLVEHITAPTFAVDAEAVPPSFFGLLGDYLADTAPAPRIDRKRAIQVDAVKRCKDLVPGVLATLPLDLVGPEVMANYGELIEQPEKNVERSVTLARTFEDIYFEGIGWWLVKERGWHGYPTKVEYLKKFRVTVDEDRKVVYVDGKRVEHSEIIRFNSPTDGLLLAGARAIRTLLILQGSLQTNADGMPPMEYFAPSTDVDPFDTNDEAREFLRDYAEQRKSGHTAFVPAALKLHAHGWNPEQMQLTQLVERATLAIANHGGIDPEEVGVSTTSRTYQNDFDRRKNFTDFTIGQFRTAFEDRMRMGDITPRGYVVRQNLDVFMRSDPKTRMETYALGLQVGAFADLQEVRALEGGAPLTPKQIREKTHTPTPAAEEATVDTSVEADQAPAETFDIEPHIRLDSPQDGAAFEVDVEKRTITGLAVPYGVPAFSKGAWWQFSKGSLKFGDVSRIKLWISHEAGTAVGFATALDDRDDGLYATFSIAPGPEGDKALALADHGTWDGLSVGLKQGGKYKSIGGVNHAVEAPMLEISLTPSPSFDDARVHAVAASAELEGTPMKCTKCGQVHGAGVVECDATALAAFEAENAGPAFNMTQLSEAITAGFAAAIGGGTGGPQVIDPTGGGAQFQVDEQPVYRFDGHAAQFSLIEDMKAGTKGDSEAKQRIDEFFNEQFAVTTANTGTLNPTVNRPDLFVPNLTFTTPLWDMVTTGSIDDRTPFTIPKFASASGLVGAHVEGVEPTPGSFAATSQTVTPGALSGKIEVNREVLDQGGSPQADQIIWGEILNAYYEAREARIAAKLASIATAELNLEGAVDAALVKAFTGVLTSLQFVRGGNRFTGLALDGMLFPKLVDAADTTGRSLLPVYGPTNAQGESSGAFDRVSIGNLTGRAAWALGASNASKSYLFVPSSVYAWSSTPKRFDFEYQLKSVDIGVWGYGAEAVTRDSDVRPIDYTTADA